MAATNWLRAVAGGMMVATVAISSPSLGVDILKELHDSAQPKDPRHVEELTVEKKLKRDCARVSCEAQLKSLGWTVFARSKGSRGPDDGSESYTLMQSGDAIRLCPKLDSFGQSFEMPCIAFEKVAE